MGKRPMTAQTFTVYESSTGKIIATGKTEVQAESIALALRIYNKQYVNVTVSGEFDQVGRNVHESQVRHDQI